MIFFHRDFILLTKYLQVSQKYCTFAENLL